VGNPFRGRLAAVFLAVALGVTIVTSCGPPARQGLSDTFFADDAPSPVASDLDEAETKWRRELKLDHADDPDALLKDDPPGKPEDYGNVADQPQPPKTFWDKFRAGAQTVGKASFAAATVLITVGMMVAPYFLL